MSRSDRPATRADCAGCREDFYNHGGNSMTGQCWLLKKAKVVTRYKIHRDAMPATPGAFKKVQVPSCYTDAGTPKQFYYESTLPTFARGVR